MKRVGWTRSGVHTDFQALQTTKVYFHSCMRPVLADKAAPNALHGYTPLGVQLVLLQPPLFAMHSDLHAALLHVSHSGQAVHRAQFFPAVLVTTSKLPAGIHASLTCLGTPIQNEGVWGNLRQHHSLFTEVEHSMF